MIWASLKIPSSKSLKGVLLLSFQPSFTVLRNLRFPKTKLFKLYKYFLIARHVPLAIPGCLCPWISRTKKEVTTVSGKIRISKEMKFLFI